MAAGAAGGKPGKPVAYGIRSAKATVLSTWWM